MLKILNKIDSSEVLTEFKNGIEKNKAELKSLKTQFILNFMTMCICIVGFIGCILFFNRINLPILSEIYQILIILFFVGVIFSVCSFTFKLLEYFDLRKKIEFQENMICLKDESDLDKAKRITDRYIMNSAYRISDKINNIDTLKDKKNKNAYLKKGVMSVYYVDDNEIKTLIMCVELHYMKDTTDYELTITNKNTELKLPVTQKENPDIDLTEELKNIKFE